MTTSLISHGLGRVNCEILSRIYLFYFLFQYLYLLRILKERKFCTIVGYDVIRADKIRSISLYRFIPPRPYMILLNFLLILYHSLI